MNELTVVRAGPLTTVQDAGRPGLAHLGVPPSGAFDRDALVRGNRLVGNAPDAAALEATLVGPALRFARPALVAVTGARASVVADAAIDVAAGELLELGPLRDGVRAYVCVRGGIAVEPVLGSRAHDLLTRVGPPPLRDGDVLPVGDEPADAPQVHEPPPPREPVLRVLPGPRDDWFPPEALDVLTRVEWRVALASNRVGVRLEGAALPRLDRGELLSEGLVTGAIQVTSSGQPILLGPDHAPTGGYPVIAVVVAADVSRAGQLGPTAAVRFAPA
jgi:biotin-dependent carboxylase-like uncharacterized protein